MICAARYARRSAQWGQPHTAERCIGHSVGGLAQVYDRYQHLDEQRAAIAAWNERLQRIVTGGADAVDMGTHQD